MGVGVIPCPKTTFTARDNEWARKLHRIPLVTHIIDSRGFAYYTTIQNRRSILERKEESAVEHNKVTTQQLLFLACTLRNTALKRFNYNPFAVFFASVINHYQSKMGYGPFILRV